MFKHKTRENILLLLRKRILLEINQSNTATHETGNCENSANFLVFFIAYHFF